jgi:hypothetical protein
MHMKRITFNPEITFGHLVQLVAMGALALGAYYKFDARITQNESAAAAALTRTAKQEEVSQQLAITMQRLTTLIEERTTPPAYRYPRESKGANN